MNETNCNCKLTDEDRESIRRTIFSLGLMIGISIGAFIGKILL